MALYGDMYEVGEFGVHGWAVDTSRPNEPVDLDIVVNARLADTIRAGLFREDLRQAGFGDGRHAFWFNPFEWWTRRWNTLEIRFPGAGIVIPHSGRILDTLTASDREVREAARKQAAAYWAAGNERSSRAKVVELLTMVERYRRFDSEMRFLEIGPGTRPVLDELQRSGRGYQFYCGVDLSRSAIEQLRERWRAPDTFLVAGPGETFPYPGGFHVALIRGTAEHLFPSIGPALEHLALYLAPGSVFVADFPAPGGELLTSRAYFDGVSGPFIRTYSEHELNRFFRRHGFAIAAVEIVTGDRAIVAALRR